MIKQITYFFTIFLLLLSGCRTIKESDFKVTNSLIKILPSLEGTIDLRNLKQKISYGSIKLSGYYDGVVNIKQDIDSLKTIEVYNNTNLTSTTTKTKQDSSSLNIVIVDRNFNVMDYRMNPDGYYTRAEFIPEKRIDDIVKLFAIELMKDSSVTDSASLGAIQFVLTSFKEKRNPFLTFFSIWTLCVPTLVGVPLTSITTTLEIQLTIFNTRHEMIGRYTGQGKGHAYVAMYWGYGEDAWRKSTLLALVRAMDSAKEKIINDKTALNIKLLKK